MQMFTYTRTLISTNTQPYFYEHIQMTEPVYQQDWSRSRQARRLPLKPLKNNIC
jgi:hypothetical protein